MFDFAQSILQPVIVDYLLWLIIPLMAWPLRLLPARWRLDIEARHREALHRAVDTAVGLVLDSVQLHPAIAIPDAVISRGLGYVEASVPDAIRRLAPERQVLEDMLRAKLQANLDSLPRRDLL